MMLTMERTDRFINRNYVKNKVFPVNVISDFESLLYILFIVGYFRRFDFGTDPNLRKYKVANPPDYKISDITAPIALFYSDNDLMTNRTVSIPILISLYF